MQPARKRSCETCRPWNPCTDFPLPRRRCHEESSRAIIGSRRKSSKSDLDGKLGVEMFDAYTGRLAAAGMDVRLRVEHDDLLHLAIPVDESVEPAEAIARNDALPGQSPLRRVFQATWLLADTQARRRRTSAPRSANSNKDWPLPSAGRRTPTRQPPRPRPRPISRRPCQAQLGRGSPGQAGRGLGISHSHPRRGAGLGAVAGKRADFALLRSHPGRGARQPASPGRGGLAIERRVRLARYALAGDELVAETQAARGHLGAGVAGRDCQGGGCCRPPRPPSPFAGRVSPRAGVV